MVATGNADLSIATEPVEPDPALVMLPCHKLQRIVLTPTGHPLLKVKRLTLEKLAEYPLITYDYAFIGRSKTLGAFEARRHPAAYRVECDRRRRDQDYVEFGLGIAIVPDMAYDRAATSICAPSSRAISSSPTRSMSASAATITCAAICSRSSNCSRRT